MPQQILVQTLYKNRLIRTREEAQAFDHALGQLAQNATPQLLPSLLQLFDDSCVHFEVMWGLVHFVESFDEQFYIQTLAQVAPSLLDQACEWVVLLHTRILNDDAMRDYYRQFLATLPQLQQERIREIFLMTIDGDTRQREKVRHVFGDV
jgi:hypothetical protein